MKAPQAMRSGDRLADLSGAESASPKKRSMQASPRAPSNNLAFYSSLPPLPATQLFLSKLKGKRRRQSFEELQYGMPARLTINHIGMFFQAATKFERQHALFLHVSVLYVAHTRRGKGCLHPCGSNPSGFLSA